MNNDDNWWVTTTTQSDTHTSHERRAGLQDLIYPLALAAFLVMGFGFGLWHPGWMAFSVAWAFDEICNLARRGRQLEKEPVELYGVATVAFLVMGFYFDMWQFSWLAYILAWIIEGVTTPSEI